MLDSRNRKERRRSPRLDTSIDAVAKTSQGARHAVRLMDLSAGGCAVTALHQPLKIGLTYGLKIDGLETLGAVASWSAGQVSGLEFVQSLHPAVADHLVRLNPPLEED